MTAGMESPDPKTVLEAFQHFERAFPAQINRDEQFAEAGVIANLLNFDETIRAAFLPEVLEHVVHSDHPGLGSTRLNDIECLLETIGSLDTPFRNAYLPLEKKLGRRLAELWGFLGMWDRVAEVLEFGQGPSKSEDLSTPLQILEAHLRYETSQEDYLSTWQQFLAKWHATIALPATDAWIPVTVRKERPTAGKLGELVRLSLSVYTAPSANHDIVSKSGHLVEDSTDYLTAVRQRVGRAHRSLARTHYHVAIDFRALYPVFGDSFQLAAALQFHHCLLRHAESSGATRTSNRFALTGRLDIDGKILPVDPRGIRQKVRTVFFSGLDGVVLPVYQIGLAEDEVARCVTRFPDRHIELIGVKNFDELLEDPRIVISEVQTNSHERYGLVKRLTSWLSNCKTRFG